MFIKEVINFLGFSEPIGIFWNVFVYIGMIFLIIAVISPKYRKKFFVLGPLILLFYSFFYLQNLLFTGLHIILVSSGILNFLNFKRIVPVIAGLSFIILAILFLNGIISDLWCWFGILALVGISFALIQLPRPLGFAVLTGASLLMFVYSFSEQIWIFAVLNIIFFFINLFKWTKGDNSVSLSKN